MPSFANDPVKTPEDQKALTLTVYQQNVALVREQRSVELPDGRSRLAVIGVPSALRPETVFKDARLRVVAGSINQARQPVRRAKAGPGIMAMRSEAARDLPASSAVSDLRVFDFPDTVTIRAQEKRQLALLTAAVVKVQKRYRLDGNYSYFGSLRRGVQRGSPIVRYRFENKADAGLGRALPRGTVRLYVPSQGGDLLRGEDNIRYTPVGEKVVLTVGLAADITSERRQTDFRRDGLPKNVVETAHRITLRNAKDEAVTVDVVEITPGDWRMLEEPQPHSKRSAAQAEWKITVPAGGEADLTYRVRTRF